MSQERIYGGSGGDDEQDELNVSAGQERRDQLASDTDDILDEIDEVLENNAEEFINAYIQKGGQ